MWEVLFQKIPSTLFEPIALFALLGIWLMFQNCAPAQKCDCRLLLWILSFMLAWRIGMQIATGRYAALLILPAILLATYACFHIHPLLKKCKVPPGWTKYASFLLFGFLIISCLIKNFSIDTDARRYLRLGDTIQADLRPGETGFLLAASKDAQRFAYYANIPPERVVLIADPVSAEELFSSTRRILNNTANATIYLLQTEPSGSTLAPELTGRKLSEEPSGKRKKKITRLSVLRRENLQNTNEIFSKDHIWQTEIFQHELRHERNAVKISGRTSTNASMQFFIGRLILPEPLDLRGKTIHLELETPSRNPNIESVFIRFYNRNELRKPVWSFVLCGQPFQTRSRRSVILTAKKNEYMVWEENVVSNAAPDQITEIEFGVGSRVPNVPIELYWYDFQIK